MTCVRLSHAQNLMDPLSQSLLSLVPDAATIPTMTKPVLGDVLHHPLLVVHMLFRVFDLLLLGH